MCSWFFLPHFAAGEEAPLWWIGKPHQDLLRVDTLYCLVCNLQQIGLKYGTIVFTGRTALATRNGIKNPYFFLSYGFFTDRNL